MPHISKHRVEGKVLQVIQDHFAVLLSRMQKKNDIHMVFGDLLTQTERTMIAKRLAIILMLERGHSFRVISKTLRVSEATISVMRDRLDKESGGFEKIINHFSSKHGPQNVEQAIMKIAKLFVMPPYAGAGRWKTSEERLQDASRKKII